VLYLHSYILKKTGIQIGFNPESPEFQSSPVLATEPTGTLALEQGIDGIYS